MKNKILLIAFSIIFMPSMSFCSNYALQFDGTNDYVQVADHDSLDLGTRNGMTVEFWAWRDTTERYDGILNKVNGYEAVFHSNNHFYTWWGLSDTWSLQYDFTPSSPQTGAWKHYAFTLTRNDPIAGTYTTCLYENAVLKATRALSSLNPPTAQTALLYLAKDDAGHFFKGRMDELRIWSVARTRVQVFDAMYIHLTVDTPGLVAYYDFDDGSGQILTDRTINHCDGILGDTVGSGSDDPTWVSGEPDIDYTTGIIHKFYVAKTGDDSNPGTEANPWLTITKAISVANEGDTVYVKSGKYQEAPLSIIESGLSTAPIIFTNNGADVDTITYIPGGPPISGEHYSPVISIGANYVTIQGFYIQGCRDSTGYTTITGYSEVGISLASGGTGVKILNNHIYDNGHCGLKIGSDASEPYILIQGNEVYNNGIHEAQDHGIYFYEGIGEIKGNVFNNNKAWGIHMYNEDVYGQPHDCIVSGNLSYDNECGGGIIVLGAQNKFYNNIAFNNPTGFCFFRGWCQYNTVKNNIFYNNDRQIMIDNAGGNQVPPANNIIDYNLYYPVDSSLPVRYPIDTTLGYYAPGVTFTYNGNVYDYYGSHRIETSPAFADTAARDFHLQAGSPAINAGVYVGLPFSGSAPDMGAFEYDEAAVSNCKINGVIR